MIFKRSKIHTRLIYFALFAVVLLGCSDLPKDDPVEFSYEKSAIAIYNPDWDVIPEPNDLLNPVEQARVGISVFGRGNDAPCATCMDIRFIDDGEIERVASKGYKADKDSDLTTWLKHTANLWDGFAPDFIPQFPFSKPVDMDSIIKYRDKGESNLSEANFFFIDITDGDNPKIIEPEDYLLVFNFSQSTELPYKMSLRRKPITTPLPEHFSQGHSYLVVMTGGEQNGIKSTDGAAFEADAPFVMMLGQTSYIAPDGSSRMNLFTDLDYIRDLEMARQLTDYGVRIWEKLVEGKRHRGEVISSFSFTINSNPLTRYFNHVPALTQANPLVPAAADAANYMTRAPLGFEPSFKLSQRIKTETANEQNVKLFRKLADGNFEKVEDTLIETVNGDAEATLTIHPEQPFEAGETYLVMATDDIMGADGLRARGDIYSILSSSPMPLIQTDGWLTQQPSSAYIDIRIEALIALINLGLTTDMQMTQESFNHPPIKSLNEATQIFNLILNQLENIRLDYASPIQWLLDNNQLSKRENLLLAYMFTMESENSADGDADIDSDNDVEDTGNCNLGHDIAYDPIHAQDMGEKDLAQADVSGVFDLYAKFEYILLPDPIELFLTGDFTQTGIVSEGTAVLDGFICIGGVAMPLIEPGVIDSEGNFTSFLEDVTIPTTLIDILENDAVGDITLTGTIYNSDGFAGTISADLKGAKLEGLPAVDIVLNGEFGARRAMEETR
jgi:hypothetical protein